MTFRQERQGKDRQHCPWCGRFMELVARHPTRAFVCRNDVHYATIRFTPDQIETRYPPGYDPCKAVGCTATDIGAGELCPEHFGMVTSFSGSGCYYRNVQSKGWRR